MVDFTSKLKDIKDALVSKSELLNRSIETAVNAGAHPDGNSIAVELLKSEQDRFNDIIDEIERLADEQGNLIFVTDDELANISFLGD